MAAVRPHLGEKRSWGKAYVPRGMQKKEDPTVNELENWKVIEAGLRQVGEQSTHGHRAVVAAQAAVHEGLSGLCADTPGGKGGSEGVSFDGIYRQVVSLVERGRGGWLYEQLVDTLTAAVHDIKLRRLQGSDECASVESLVAVWEEFEQYAKRVRNLTSYLEVQWIRRSGVDPLLDVAHARFVAFILPTFLGDAVRRLLCDNLSLATVLRDRCISAPPLPDGRVPTADPELVSRAVAMVKQLKDADIDGFLVGPLAAHYARDARTIRGNLLQRFPELQGFAAELTAVVDAVHNALARHGVPGWAVDRLRGALLCNVLDEEVWAFVLERTPAEVAAKRLDAVQQCLVFADAVDTAKTAAIHDRVLHTLEKMAPTAPGQRRAIFLPPTDASPSPPNAMALLTAFHSYITGLASLFAEGDPRESILHAEGKLLNDSDAVAYTCSKYLDYCVKAVLRGETSAEAVWGDFETMYALLHQKDVLEELCRRKLATRLLSYGKEAGALLGTATEAAFVRLFKLAQPSSSTVSRMEEMLKDAVKSADEVQAWRETFTDARAPPATFLTLKSSAWPNNVRPNSVRITLPSILDSVVSGFGEWYLEKHTGRTLTWNHAVGYCTLLAHLDKKHDISCSLVDASILIACFAEQDECSVADIEGRMGTKGCIEVRSAIERLVGSRVLLAKVRGDGGAFAPDDVLCINTVHRTRKIVVGKTKKVGESAERAEPAEVMKERKALVEAAIVRIMKSRRTLHINELVAQVTQQMSARFKPDVPFIKKRIDDLLSRGFISRSDDDRSFFVYES